jgi:hypothetical protein
MLMKDVKVGEVYAMLSWGGRETRGYSVAEYRGTQWEAAGQRAQPVRVLETSVDVPGYRRPGVLVRRLDRDTLEDAPKHDGTPVDEFAVHTAQLLAPWAELHAAYHDWLDELEEKRVREQEEREREKARRQEKAARDWMEREFAAAANDIDDVVKVLSLPPVQDLEAKVRELVEMRNPDGNPYLNGEREAW